MSKTKLRPLRPTVTHPLLWNPSRPTQTAWQKTRTRVLERDNNTCQYCGHWSWHQMHVHHFSNSNTSRISSLATTCVACHAVLHIGRNLALRKVQIWKSALSQVEIVRRTRIGITDGKTLKEIKHDLSLTKPGLLPCSSILWARALTLQATELDEPTAALPEPYCAVFVDFTKWQIEPEPVKIIL